MESRVATSTASPLAVLGPGPLTAYWQFQRAVAKAQLAAWLPARRGLLVDISGPGRRGGGRARQPGVPRRRLRGRRDRRGWRTVPAPHGGGPRRGDRAGAAAR